MVKQNFEDNPKSSHKDLSLSVVHILATYSSNLRKGVQQEFYQLGCPVLCTNINSRV